MINLKERLKEIQANKTEELKKINVFEIDYAILKQEIEDVKACFEALNIEDRIKRDSALYSIKFTTTSSSLYDALIEYLKEQSELESNPNNDDAEVKFSDSLSLDELKYIAEEYGKLVNEHAHLLHFKEVALNHLTEEQLEAIEDEMNDIPEKAPY